MSRWPGLAVLIGGFAAACISPPSPGVDATTAPAEDGGPVVDPCSPGVPAPDVIELSGVVLDNDGVTTLADVGVTFDPDGFDTSDSEGVWAIDLATDGEPVPLKLRLQAGDSYPLHTVRSQRPLQTTPVELQTRLLSFATLEALYGATPRDAEARTIAVFVVDCAGAGVGGQTVEFDPPAEKTEYFGGGAETGATGLGFGLNVPGDFVTVSSAGAASMRLQPPPGSVLQVTLVLL
ncbi:MAG TPA: hypothetical protein VMZ28_12490 [Kofleriaceae bacterium]|nr:hypothetical protein [Kofleriaceae bacterium]